MSLRFSSRRVCLCATACLVGGLLAGRVQAADRQRGRPINEFPVPKSSEITTNLQHLTSKKDGLKRLEEDLYGPLQSFAPQSSLDGVVARPPRPPARTAIQSKRVKELLERRKDWVFMTPEDLLAAPTIDEILHTPQLELDPKEKQDLSAVERYYQRLAAKHPEASSSTQPGNEIQLGLPTEANPGDESGSREVMNLPANLRESAEALKKLFDLESSASPLAQGATHGNFVDTFGLDNTVMSKEQEQDHKKLMNQYRALVDPNWSPPTTSTPNLARALLADAVSPAARPAASAPSPANPAPRTALEMQLDVADPLLGPARLPDVNAQALGQIRPTLPLPKIEPTRVAPVAPTFTAPRRSFR